MRPRRSNSVLGRESDPERVPARKICAALVRGFAHRLCARAGTRAQAGSPLRGGGVRADSIIAFFRKRRLRARRHGPHYTMELRKAHPEVEMLGLPKFGRGRLGYRDGPSVAVPGLTPLFFRSLSRPSRVRLELTGPACFCALRARCFGREQARLFFCGKVIVGRPAGAN